MQIIRENTANPPLGIGRDPQFCKPCTTEIGGVVWTAHRVLLQRIADV
jgi:hypothetical protein